MASTGMENCYLNWKKKVSDTRKEYQELNFFTTQQMMLLRREIAIACCRRDLHVDNLQILTLLESVRTNVDTEVLKAAIQRAFKDTGLLDQIKRMEDLRSFSLTPHQEKFDTSTSLFENNNYVNRSPSTGVTSPQVQNTSIKKEKPKDVSKIQRFLNAAEDEGYSEQVALSALASLGVDAEEDDLLLWCLEESDDADLESLYETAMANPIIVREIYPQEVLDAQEIQLEEARCDSVIVILTLVQFFHQRYSLLYNQNYCKLFAKFMKAPLSRLRQQMAPKKRLTQVWLIIHLQYSYDK